MRKLTEFQWRLNSLSEPLSILQLCTNNGVLFPNLKTLALLGIQGSVVPFIPLFLSLRTTSITLNFWNTDLPNAAVASVITTIPTLCPELQMICLCHLPRDPMITAAVSGMLLATNRDTLQHFYVDSPLTEEASEVVYKLPNLCDLSVVIEKETSLPEASLPNLTEITIKCEDEGDWPRLFYGASLGKLETVTFCPQSEKIGDFLGAFERAALSSSLQNTLSKFSLEPGCSWNPNYSSLLPFTQLVELNIGFSCDGGCSSRVDDNIVINLSRKMPGLRALQLGCDPCREFTIGVTAEGLMALALHCPDLRLLCIHFQVDSLTAPPASPGMSPNAKPTDSWTDCALTELVVGKIPAPESALMVTLALLRIFPRIEAIASDDEGWQEVEDAIRLSKQIVDCSSKQHPLDTCCSNLGDTSIGAKLKISER